MVPVGALLCKAGGWGQGPGLLRLGKKARYFCPLEVNLGWASKQAKRFPDATEVPPPL